MSLTTENQTIKEAVALVAQFMGKAQLLTLAQLCKSEEGEHFLQKLLELTNTLENMPETYEQDGKGEQAIVYLHYFLGGMDWHITERDCETEQLQAFGLADLGMGCPELGYISIQEITSLGAELDLYWAPKTIAEIKGPTGLVKIS